MELKEIDKLYDVRLSSCDTGDIDFTSSEVDKYMGFINKYRNTTVSLIAYEVDNIKEFYQIDDLTASKLDEATKNIKFYSEKFSSFLENFDNHINDAKTNLKKLTKKCKEEIKNNEWQDYEELIKVQTLLKEKINHKEDTSDEKSTEEELFANYTNETVRNALIRLNGYDDVQRKASYKNLISTSGGSDTELAKAIRKEFPEVID